MSPGPKHVFDESMIARPAGLVASDEIAGGNDGRGEGGQRIFDDGRVVTFGPPMLTAPFTVPTSTLTLAGGAADVAQLLLDLEATGIFELQSGAYEPDNPCCDLQGHVVQLHRGGRSWMCTAVGDGVPTEIGEAVGVIRARAAMAR